MDLKNKLTIIIIGRSGSGKGTQAGRVIECLKKSGVRRIETGRLLRELLVRNNPTTIIARELMKKGGIFPYWFASFIWLNEIIENGAMQDHIVLDGAPRKIEEAKLLDDVCEWHGRRLPLCVYINVGRKEAYRRLISRKRADDNPSAIHNRLNFFTTDVMPVINYYKKYKRVLTINGEQEVEAVWHDLNRRLSKRLGRLWRDC